MFMGGLEILLVLTKRTLKRNITKEERVSETAVGIPTVRQNLQSMRPEVVSLGLLVDGAIKRRQEILLYLRI